MNNLPQSLADLEFKDVIAESPFSFEQPQFKKILHRHWKDKNFTEMQRKIAEEYRNLRDAALEMNEAEAAFHRMMQVRQKLVDVYRELMVKSEQNSN